MTAMQWFFSFLKKYRMKLIIALFLVTCTSALAIVNPYISGIIVDDVIKKGNRNLLGELIILLISTTVIRSVLRYIYLYIFETSSQGMLYTMRDHVYRRLLHQDFNFYNKNRTGDLMSRQTGDMDAIRHFVAYVIYSIYENSLLFLFALIMIFTVDFRLALCMIAVMPITVFITYKQLTAIKPAFHKIRQQFSSLNTFVQENVSGNRVVKAFAKEDYEISKFNKENDAYRDSELNAAAIWKKYVPIFEFLSSSLTFILYLVGGIMVIKGYITIGKLVTVSGYLWMLNNPLRMAGWLANDYQRFVTSVEKIYSTINIEPNIKEPKNAVEKKKLNGEVEFRHVSYLADDDVILTDINFKVSPGQTVGIIGATGSGKSTLMNLLCRFYDVTDGEILIDGINVKNMDLYSLRDSIGMAMQDVFLFSDTIEGNIAYGKPNCSFEEVKAAAKIANADEFIMETQDGYDTIVGERGMGLSGGQKQRISLARALLKDPSIVILDDTTSAVDMETEFQIQNELNSLSTSRTVFLIAHRISSIKDADLILVVDDGKIIESGNHQSLIDKNGYYATVFNHQYGEFNQMKNRRQKGGTK
ncbi:ABC transporter ATP-binding protein [Anaeromicropila herbilytica]|uniref:ABC transporter ATP-binding protein n=1 Tax=Anaeromicropila herbilytica TaxID=2785025 RepID=A0A7R7EKB8_9FIRM|nr:ABC transporter ATP-binding protein [Anaeromicropila herbilytica]BCN30181.1 ABC transporter ATP-binding protein [Anaeromicropila herbilytica]